MGSYVVTGNEEQERQKCSSILTQDQFFNSEADFCRVYSEDVLLEVEGILLWNHISYCIREENTSLFSRIFGMKQRSLIIRINSNDMEYAFDLVEGIRGVELVGELPEEDWVPVRAKQRREEEKDQARRFTAGRSRDKKKSRRRGA